MLLTEKFDYKKLQRATEPNGERRYITPTGALPSVTTVLDKTKTEEQKQSLNNWRKRVGYDEAQRIVTESANLGTIMHKHLECHIEGPDSPTGTNYIRKRGEILADILILEGLKNVDEVWGVEVPLYMPDLYAGTTDCVGLYKGKPAIIDFKTSRKNKKREWIHDYFMQGSAYALAHNEVYDTKINTIVIMMMTHDGDYLEFVCEGDEFEDFSVQWLTKVDAYYIINN